MTSRVLSPAGTVRPVGGSKTALGRVRGVVDGLRTGSLSPARLVIAYAFLLLCLPSQLIVRQIGAPGTPANLWAIGLLLLWVLGVAGGTNPVRGFTTVRVAVGLLALSVMASYVAANTTGWYAPVNVHQVTDEVYDLVAVSTDQLNEKMVSAADRGLLSFAGWAGLALVAAEGIRTDDELDRVVGWIVKFGAFVAVLGIVQYFTGFDIAALFRIPGLSANSDFGLVDTRSSLNRVSGTAVHPIEFGVVLAIVFLLALHRSLHATAGTTTSRWLPTMIIGIALPMSVSRSAILVAAVGLFVIVCGWPASRRAWALLSLPVVVLGVRLLAPGLVGTIRSLFANVTNDPSISGRTDDYRVVLALYSDHPILGRGLFTFVPRYYRILDNQILMTLLELGLLGLVALLLFFGASLGLARSTRRVSPDERGRHLGLVLSGCLVGLALSYVTFDAWGFPMVAGITFLTVGLTGAAHRISRTASNEEVLR